MITISARKIRTDLSSYLFITPSAVLVGIFTVFPILFTGYLSLTNYSLYRVKNYIVIGFENYRKILTGINSVEVLRVLIWTLVWASVSTIAATIVGLMYAMILNNPKLKGRYVYRTLLIIPWAMPSFISIMMWQGLLNINFGAINQILSLLGISAVPWLTDPFWARLSVLVVNLWLSFPFMMVVGLGALQSIPKELYEAAEVDGASRWKRLIYITLPRLKPTILPVCLMSFANHFNNFGGIYLLTSGGPAVVGGSLAGSTDILISYTYKLAFQKYLYGMGSAFCVLLFLVVAGISVMNMKLTGALKEGE